MRQEEPKWPGKRPKTVAKRKKRLKLRQEEPKWPGKRPKTVAKRKKKLKLRRTKAKSEAFKVPRPFRAKTESYREPSYTLNQGQNRKPREPGHALNRPKQARKQAKKHPTIRWGAKNQFLFLSVNDILTSGTVTNHGDGISDALFDEFDVLSAVFGKLIVFLNTADVFFPAGKSLVYRFCLL